MKRKHCEFCCAALLIWCGMSSRSQAVDVWLTTGDKSSLLAQQQDTVFQPGNGTGGLTINVSPSTTFQQIEGFGASLTDSSAWLIENELDATQRDKLMHVLFEPTHGIGMSYLRLPMGASDFTASEFYTYNDLPGGHIDIDQSEFSIAHDTEYIIPQLQQARTLNPSLKLMASPWSAPAWMKTSGSLIGGELRSPFYQSYATYFQKFIEAYAAQGIPIDAVTMQNEPLFVPPSYPGMSMSVEQQIELIKNHVGPLFEAAEIDTKIVVYDHNWDNVNYAIDALNVPQVKQYVAGSAFHGYAGNVSAQSLVHDAHPDRSIYFTEISGGEFAPNFADNLVWGIENIIIGSTRNWGETAIYWNLALDENNGPHRGGCSDCRGVVTIDTATGNLTHNEEFYTIAHASKFVQPGAVRIDSRTINNSVETVAFKNPDGTLVLIALNPSSTSKSFRVVEAGEHFAYQLPPKAVATFSWPSRKADFDNAGFEQLGGTLNAWTVFGNPIGNVSVAEQALAGDYALRLSGQFTPSANYSGVSQGISVTAGDTVRAKVSTYVEALDALLGTGNQVVMKIEFFSEFGGAFGTSDLISEHQITIANAQSATNDWLEHSLVETTPAGAEEARLVFYFFQPSGESGSVLIDQSLLEVVPDFLESDFNQDGMVDGLDLEQWQGDYGINWDSDADEDGDNDGVDFLYWQQQSSSSPADSSKATAVPEPSSQSCLLVAICLVAWVGKKNKFKPLLLEEELGTARMMLEPTSFCDKKTLSSI